jgi:hypothetical protein
METHRGRREFRNEWLSFSASRQHHAPFPVPQELSLVALEGALFKNMMLADRPPSLQPAEHHFDLTGKYYCQEKIDR